MPPARGRRKAATPAPVLEKPVVPKDPLDFSTLPIDSLRKYRSYHNLPVSSPMTTAGYMVHSGVGKQTVSGQSNARTSKEIVAKAVKEHFMNEAVRESETIVDFVYSIQNKDKVFKLQW